MDGKYLGKSTSLAAFVFAALVVSQVQASYICTGASGAASGNPYFDGDLTDAACDTSEVEAALGITIDTNLIVGSKSNSSGAGPLFSWSQDEFGLGTLSVTSASRTSGSWSLTGGGITPLFFVDKYDGGYDVFSYMGGSTDPFSDSWDDSKRGTVGSATCRVRGTGDINCGAATSHVSVYSVVPIPAAVWLFGSGLLGLVGCAAKRRS